MSQSEEGRKAGLKYGDASAIAREVGLSVPHVTLVLRGLRPMSAKVAKAITRKRRANARAAARQAAKAEQAHQSDDAHGKAA